MFEEKAGTYAGQVWEALNERGALSNKQLKTVLGVRSEKDLYLALGWLLREDKILVKENGKDIKVELK